MGRGGGLERRGRRRCAGTRGRHEERIRTLEPAAALLPGPMSAFVRECLRMSTFVYAEPGVAARRRSGIDAVSAGCRSDVGEIRQDVGVCR